MLPSYKTPEIERLLERQYGRTTAIVNNKCINPPLGCGKDIVYFINSISRMEYTISGLCQTCQDKLFRKGNQ